MKSIFLILLFGLIGLLQLPAQCSCDFQIEIVQDTLDPCAFDVLICNNGGPNCNPANNFTDLLVYSNANPNLTQPIAGVSTQNPNVTTSQPTTFQAQFSTNFNVIAPACPTKINVGRFFLNPLPNFTVQFSVTMFPVSGSPCDFPLPTTQFTGSCGAQPGYFEKIYGDAEENRPTAVKAFGNGMYVSGYRIVGGTEYGTLSKFDITSGALLWEKQLLTASRLLDFDYNLAADTIIAVGHSWPLNSSTDNSSILITIDAATGAELCSKHLNHPGREGFTRIVRHPNPDDIQYPFYILGRKNPTTFAPSGNDIVMVYNVDASCNVKWATEYDSGFNNPVDDEFLLGLAPIANGDLILTGPVINNDGALVEIDGSSGSAILFRFTGQALDIYDAIRLPDGKLMIVGENWATHNAFVAILIKDPATQVYTTPPAAATLEFAGIENFKDIWADQYGKLYVIGESKTVPNYQVVHKLNCFTHAGNYSVTVDWAKYLEDLLYSEIDYENGRISVTATHDRIFYADARLKNQPFFGNWDMLVGSFDLNLLAACGYDFPVNTTALPLTAIPLMINYTQFPEPTFAPCPIRDLESCCTSFCSSSPCIADFTWVQGNCFSAQFTANSSSCLQGSYIYDWDFGDGSASVTTNNLTVNHTFPCGGGLFTVCLTVTDPLGCIATQCYMVNVDNCEGCATAAGTLMCSANNFDAFDFTITVTPDINIAAASCSFALTSLQSNVALSNVAQNGNLLTGTATVIAWPTPTALNLGITMTCTCPNPPGGSFTCNVPVAAIPTYCCKMIQVDAATACKDAETLDVPIQFFGSPCNITQVTWYVQDKPPGGICPTTIPGGKPYQDNLTNVLEPLHLYPADINGDLCVYAVVHMTDGPCTALTSNVACINFCAPTTCDLLNNQEHCYAGTCFIPAPLTVNLNSPPNACFSSIQWFDPDNNLVQQGPSTTYTPTQCLSMDNPLTDCYQDFFYTLVITDLCGQRECQARIRLYSDDAPKGTLEVDPFEANTLCPFESVTLKFTPGCDKDDPKTWTWNTRPCDPALGGCTPIPDAGMMNPMWSTNILLGSAWYYVETQNGVCPIDSVQLLLEVKEELMIMLFDAIPDPCVEQQVDLSVFWKPCILAGCPPGTPCNDCSHTVDWYKDCTKIGTTNEAAGVTSSSFTYTNPPLAGNYYAVVKDDCCPNNMATSMLVEVFPACEPVVTGPCFRCNNEMVMLTAMGVILPTAPCPYLCSYSWSTLDGIITTDPTLPTITVDASGTYTVTTSCILNGGQICVKTDSFTLTQCQRSVSGLQECAIVDVEELLLEEYSPVRVFPNPTIGGLTIEWSAGASRNTKLFITDVSGKILRSLDIPDAVERITANIDELPAGIYFVKIQSDQVLYQVAKLVKQ